MRHSKTLGAPRITLVAALMAASACTLVPRRAAKPRPRPGSLPASASPAAPAIDHAAQRKAYDLGLKLFGEERYQESRKAWAEAVRLGPGTELGRKSSEHLRKVDQMLKTLRELESK